MAAADALFREARASARTGDHATACPKFRESYRLDPSVGTLLNVADCEERDRHLVDALQRFEEAAGRLASSDDRVTYVRSRIRTIEGRVARIVGTGASGAGVRMLVDGAEVPTTNADASIRERLDPGAHEVRVVGKGRDDRLVVVLKEGETKVVDLALAPTPARPPVPARSESSSNTLPLVIGGVGAAGLVTSGVLAVLMLKDKKTADAHCVGSECDQTGIDATAAGKRFGTLGGLAFAAGAIGVGLGTFLFFHGRPSATDAAAAARTRSLSLGPTMIPGGGSLVLGGTL